MVLVGGLEKRAEVGPAGDVGFDEGESGGGWRVSWGVEVTANYGGAKGEEEGDCCEANA